MQDVGIDEKKDSCFMDQSQTCPFTPSLKTPMKRIMNFALRECQYFFGVLCVVFLCTVFRYGLTSPNAWLTPPHYDSDSLYMLTLFEAVSRGECLPYTSFNVSTLGAPFTANWNDFPVTSPLLLYSGGLLVTWFGLGVASNIVLVFAHLASSAAMFLSLRTIGVLRIWSFVFSICFGLAPFLFHRGLTHLVLTFAYSVPITCAICYLIFKNGARFLTGWRLALVAAIGFYFGGIFLYFTAFFLMMMAFCALYCLVNEKKFRTLLPFLLVAFCTLANFYLVTQPFRSYADIHGKNELAVSRFYSNVQTAALRPVEMFLPGSDSKIPVLKQVSRFYENQDLFRQNFPVSAESMVSYLGMPGILGFCLLTGMSAYFIFTRQQQKIPGWFWVVSFFLSFAVVGGLNGFLGLGKFFLLRSSNRVSIYILAACLFFLALLLTRISNKIPRIVQFLIAFVIVGTACFEAATARASSRHYEARLWDSDQKMVSKLEEILPDGAMLFNYPVIAFPESGTYAHLRPYLFSHDLRFSFGSVKGRSREAWQLDVSKLEPSEILKQLEEYGFSGVLVYSGGGLDKDQRAAALNMLDFFKNNDLPAISSAAGDFHFLQLQPSEHPMIPGSGPLFIKNWWENSIQPDIPAIRSVVKHEPGRPNWATHQSAVVEFYVSDERLVSLQGQIASVCDAKVQIFYGKEKLWEGHAGPEKWVRFETSSFKVPQGTFRLEFKSDCETIIQDGRKFTFGIAGLKKL
jgi:hypothetical protein